MFDQLARRSSIVTTHWKTLYKHDRSVRSAADPERAEVSCSAVGIPPARRSAQPQFAIREIRPCTAARWKPYISTGDGGRRKCGAAGSELIGSHISVSMNGGPRDARVFKEIRRGATQEEDMATGSALRRSLTCLVCSHQNGRLEWPHRTAPLRCRNHQAHCRRPKLNEYAPSRCRHAMLRRRREVILRAAYIRTSHMRTDASCFHQS